MSLSSVSVVANALRLRPRRIGAAGPPAAAGQSAVDDQRKRLRAALLDASGNLRQRLPAFGRADALQQHPHGALTAAADAEQQVVLAAHVVARQVRNTGRQHLACVLDQVHFETPARQQAVQLRAGRDQHLRAGLAVGRTLGRDHGREDEGIALGLQFAEITQQRREGCCEGMNHGA
jgi:hypothetical protein